MNEIKKYAFNDGNNNGKITFNSNDNMKIRCHSFIFKTKFDYGKSLFHFESNKNEKVKNINVNYEAKLIIIMLNRMVFT